MQECHFQQLPTLDRAILNLNLNLRSYQAPRSKCNHATEKTETDMPSKSHIKTRIKLHICSFEANHMYIIGKHLHKTNLGYLSPRGKPGGRGVGILCDLK